jgi:uncharacterized protein (TIGR03083 family)
VDGDAYLDAIRLEGGRLGAAARRAPTARVPSCPKWDMFGLLAHIEAIHRWVAAVLRTRATERQARTEVGPGVGFVELADAYDAGLADLLGCFAATDPAEAVWNWSTGVAPAAFWWRRMAQETAVHRWDAENAAAAAAPFATALAADGIDEFLGIAAHFVAHHPIAGLTGSLALVAPDEAVSWHLELAPDRVDRRIAFDTQATVTAGASDLYLWLLHRIPVGAGSVVVTGDPAVAEAWDLVIFD